MTEQLHMKTAWELAQKLQAGEITSLALTELFLERIARLNPKMNVFLAVDEHGAREEARAVDADRLAGKELPFFAGVPVALKDNMCQRGIPTTAASKMLQGWLPPYDATVVRLLKEARLPILGHTNMDEFAMGSSTEHSAFGPTQNPWGRDLIPGGSGGGSAAAVAGYLAPWALGTDTGGSIRQPGAMTGTVGTKPTYGAVSRYGIIALASSLDQVGPVARDVRDAAALQEIISKHDPLDSTSLTNDFSDLVAAVNEGKQLTDLSGVTFGIVKELDGEGFSQGVLDTYHGVIEKLKNAGANFVEVSCPSFDYAMSAYYLIMPAEMSSNLARYDGVRFGNRVLPQEGPVTAETMMAATREAGFGPEVKRRLILGTYALSAGTYDAYYGSAQRVRTLVQRDMQAAYEKVDVLLTPATPSVAFKFGEKLDDPMAMYKNDMTTIPANLAGTPAMTIPVGLSQGLPVGIQIMAPTFQDARMYKVAAMVENVADRAASHPDMDMWED
ncbi:Asp-tRNA(Asn)/Glu-tRNA(Gln) amidotransferase subunit GatA [Arcanobacterium pinnipediorum]|uniref:Glutamyl-tRNA(Gln) amidotransferase subunit A n=1 Tax=Arcanobacterium pinnipediorum TaxID=1503041 RepID=A0ABY5AK18_9ACTO|nr:Asp-tRNA(Asn)/Glu-tRNA(Gln) amidotransferase subunit GatA [Arcanobacterium pinnipediorum]USR79786.1 Asp-tRNA(Asn)/Glu-tRNA(Gln) amidotransferase subunit GatA [Arcanobacterium pinnipediorum]